MGVSVQIRINKFTDRETEVHRHICILTYSIELMNCTSLNHMVRYIQFYLLLLRSLFDNISQDSIYLLRYSSETHGRLCVCVCARM